MIRAGSVDSKPSVMTNDHITVSYREEMSHIRQIIYVSTSIDELDSDSLNALLIQSRRNNQRERITGVLFYHLGIFIQVLEGPSDSIEILMQKIMRDNRHKRMIILHDEKLASWFPCLKVCLILE